MTNIERLQNYAEMLGKCEYNENEAMLIIGLGYADGYKDVDKKHYQEVLIKWREMRKFINQRMLTLTEKIWDDLKTESEKLQNF